MQVMSSGVIALQLLGRNTDKFGIHSNPSPAKALSPAATRYVAAVPQLEGVYSDPRAERSAQAQPSLAQRVTDSIQKTLATDVADLETLARERLEEALGRPLGDDEGLWDLDSYTRVGLPKDVSSMNRAVDHIKHSFGIAMTRPAEVNLDRVYSLDFSEGMKVLDRPRELRGLDMSSAEDRQTAIDYAIKLQANINMSGVRLAESDKMASEMMTKVLDGAGVEGGAELLESYVELHRARFEAGEFSVLLDGVEISYLDQEPAQS